MKKLMVLIVLADLLIVKHFVGKWDGVVLPAPRVVIVTK